MATHLVGGEDSNDEYHVKWLIRSILSTLRILFLTRSDDKIDRLNHVITVVGLLVFALFVIPAHFIGEPIHCWCPAEFTAEFISYTHSYCWVRNTYSVPMEAAIPAEAYKKEQGQITYYQWVPWILLFQALLFKLPNIIWRLLNAGCGVQVDVICEKAAETQFYSPTERNQKVENLASSLDRWIWQREHEKSNLVGIRTILSKYVCFPFNRMEGTYLTSLYLFIKFATLINVIGQFYILNAFMATDYSTYGFEFIKMLSSGDPMRESPRFPKVTLCDFEIRQLENIQQWTVQCTLPINLFNEKIFIVLWFWFFFVACVTGINLAIWIYTVSLPLNNYKFVKKYVALARNTWPLGSAEKKLCRKFAESYLRSDGCLLLRMIGYNSTDIVVLDLLNNLLDKYKSAHPHGN